MSLQGHSDMHLQKQSINNVLYSKNASLVCSFRCVCEIATKTQTSREHTPEQHTHIKHRVNLRCASDGLLLQ